MPSNNHTEMPATRPNMAPDNIDTYQGPAVLERVMDVPEWPDSCQSGSPGNSRSPQSSSNMVVGAHANNPSGIISGMPMLQSPNEQPPYTTPYASTSMPVFGTNPNHDSGIDMRRTQTMPAGSQLYSPLPVRPHMIFNLGRSHKHLTQAFAGDISDELGGGLSEGLVDTGRNCVPIATTSMPRHMFASQPSAMTHLYHPYHKPGPPNGIAQTHGSGWSNGIHPIQNQQQYAGTWTSSVDAAPAQYLSPNGVAPSTHTMHSATYAEYARYGPGQPTTLQEPSYNAASPTKHQILEGGLVKFDSYGRKFWVVFDQWNRTLCSVPHGFPPPQPGEIIVFHDGEAFGNGEVGQPSRLAMVVHVCDSTRQVVYGDYHPESSFQHNSQAIREAMQAMHETYRQSANVPLRSIESPELNTSPDGQASDVHKSQKDLKINPENLEENLPIGPALLGRDAGSGQYSQLETPTTSSSSGTITPESISKRHRKTQEQLEMLQESFDLDPFPTTLETIKLVHASGLTGKQVNAWFWYERKKVDRAGGDLRPGINPASQRRPQIIGMTPTSLPGTSIPGSVSPGSTTPGIELLPIKKLK